MNNQTNELYSAVVAAAFLSASGRPIKMSTEQAVDLVKETVSGVDVRDVAAALTAWTPRIVPVGSVPEVVDGMGLVDRV
ncbi:hypothetical protein [Streptomyces sp. bgisy082]|uniref:hypothetical protein n=1 Tax=Streptomyces sp. bgisy082 TaxID=3413776 RepID=UPI003D758320